VDDLDGARRDYDTALPIFREIHARLGEANTRQSLGNLRLAEGKPEDALAEYLAALDIHIQVQARLSMGADLGYTARAAGAAEQHGRAALFDEWSLAIHRAIGERWGQILNLQHQAEALWALKAQGAALAAWWQAREIARAIGAPQAGQLDALFGQVEQQIGAEQYQALAADLQAHAEERRQEAIAALRQAAEQDPLIQAIAQALGQS